MDVSVFHLLMNFLPQLCHLDVHESSLRPIDFILTAVVNKQGGPLGTSQLKNRWFPVNDPRHEQIADVSKLPELVVQPGDRVKVMTVTTPRWIVQDWSKHIGRKK
jgi:hypothetical protein